MLIEIYTKPNCPACFKIKKGLNAAQLPYKEFVLGENITREEVKAKFPDAKYVPIVIIDGIEGNPADIQLLLG